MEIKKVYFGVQLWVREGEHAVIDEGGEDVSYLREVVLPLAKAMKPECVVCDIRVCITEANEEGQQRTLNFDEEFTDGDELIEFLEKITYTKKFLDVDVPEGVHRYLKEKLAEMARPPERQAWE